METAPDDPSASHDTTRPRLCDLGYWRLERVHGADPGYLVTLRCTREHLHYAALLHGSHAEARALIDRWEADTLPDGFHVLIEDAAAGVLDRRDGRIGPLREGP